MKFLLMLKEPVLAILLLLIAWTATQRLQTPQADRSDEPEWTAISLNTVRKFEGATLSGVQRDTRDAQLHEDPWRQGVLATTFGWPNPILHKLVWGKVCAPLAPERLSPDTFQRYHGGDLNKANAAVMKIVPAIEQARKVVAFESALCAVLLFLIAARLAGWMAGTSAFLLWLYHPLIRAWSHQARPDFGMLLLMLACLYFALVAAESLCGEGSSKRLVGTSLMLGALAGLCVGTKLNGGLAAIFVVSAILLGGFFSSEKEEHSWTLRTRCALGSGLLVAGLLFALMPYLWSQPLAHLKEVLDFWSDHMAMQQDRIETLGGVATRTTFERLDLVIHRMGGQEDPLMGALGIAGGMLWNLLGVVALILAVRWSALRTAGDGKLGMRVATGLLWIVVVGGGSILWLPLNWDRYLFPLVACSVLLEACLLGVLLRLPLAIKRLEPRL